MQLVGHVAEFLMSLLGCVVSQQSNPCILKHLGMVVAVGVWVCDGNMTESVVL